MPKSTRSRPLSVEKPSAALSNTFLARDIEIVATDALKRYARDLRLHSDKQVAQIGASIRAFGFLVPVVVTTDNLIVAGHGRWLAACELGLPQVPIIRSGHLSPERLRAFRLADNRLAENAGWNRDALALELSELTDLVLDFELELTGFETAEIDLIIDGPAEVKPSSDDDCPVPTSAAVTQLGDLWRLDAHHLLCGSALAAESYERLLGDGHVRMVFSDPPYNVPVSGHVCGSGRVKHREFAMASGEMSEPQFVEFLETTFGHLSAKLVQGGLMYIAMDHRHVFELTTAARRVGLDQINLCVWNKTNAGMGSFYRSKHELIFVLKRPGAPHLNTIELGRHGRYRTNVWDFAGVNSFGRRRMEELSSHPTVKPVALVMEAIKDCTRRGDGVLDAFCGSGTTLIAAERAARIGFGIELDPVYVDVTVKRWQTLTGKPAVLDATGETFDVVASRRTVPNGTSIVTDPAPAEARPDARGIEELSHV